MKTHIFDINGKKEKEITLPSVFSNAVREDIVAKVVEARKTRQPYAPSPVGGKQHSASGKIQHVRHVWKTMQGKGISRVPRKIMSRRGSQFNWVGAEIPNGVINGINTIFTLLHPPIGNSLLFTINGIVQQNGTTGDYTLSGSTITLVTGAAIPNTGDVIQAWYRY